MFATQSDTPNSQDVGEDTDGPHVGVEANRLDLGDLRGSELSGRGGDFGDFCGIQLGGEPEVDELDVGGF